jgi:hypothetical protein
VLHATPNYVSTTQLNHGVCLVQFCLLTTWRLALARPLQELDILNESDVAVTPAWQVSLTLGAQQPAAVGAEKWGTPSHHAP